MLLRQIRARKLHVLVRRYLDPVSGLALELLLDLSGAPAATTRAGISASLADHAARGDQCAFADRATVEQRRIASDQGVALDRAILHHRAVADGHVVADERSAALR